MPRLIAMTMAALLSASGAAAYDEAALLAQSRALVAEFVGALKPRLQAALQAGGPASAIHVCAELAPQIADSLSESSGWAVRRVSLRARNRRRAIPDDSRRLTWPRR